MTNPTWAGRSATPPSPEGDKEQASWIPVVGVIAALGLVGVGGYMLGSTDSGEAIEAASSPTTLIASAPETTAPETTAPETTAPETTAPETTAPSGDTILEAEPEVDAHVDAAATADAENEGSATAEPTDIDTEEADNAEDETATATAPQVVVEDGEVRGAVLLNGTLYLGGEVPSREFADQIIERAAAIVGEDNIVDEYVVNPDAAVEQGAPLYVDDVVLFAYGSNRYDPAFEPLLDLGLALLMQNPSVTVTIITHTDASGSASYNDRLSYQRGQSVAQYWVDRGVPVDQIVIDARGERDPRASNDSDEGAQLNRRAEFYIEGLLP